MIECLNTSLQFVLLKYFLVLSSHGQMPPVASVCSRLSVQHALRFWSMLFSSRCFNCLQTHHWLLTMMIEERHYFPKWRSILDFFITFGFCLISFDSVLSYDKKMKQKEKEVYTHFILSYSLYEHQTWVFYLILPVDTFLVSWNIIPINPCLQTPWNIYWIIQYRF